MIVVVKPKWVMSVQRQTVEPETRWLHRHILRRRWRTKVQTVFSGPMPDGVQFERSMNKPSRLTFPADIELLSALDRLDESYPV